MTVQVRLVPRSHVHVRQMGAGPAGQDGWTPVFASAVDGDRRVLQVIDWVGGEGQKPVAGQYVGATGLVEAIGSAVDVRGPKGAAGWAPVFAVASDGLRRVLQLVDWAGGEGTKPAISGADGATLYLGTSGFVIDITQAVDIRGSQGIQGEKGWAPVLSVQADGERRVHRVEDWAGGQGGKPATGQYIGASGLVATADEAVDIRGQTGSPTTNDSITNAHLADVPQQTLKGRVSAGNGDPQDLTADQVRSMLGNMAHGQCRFEYVSGTTCRLRTHNGNKLIINGAQREIPSAGVDLSNTGLAASTVYYVYAYWTGTAIALEASITGHVTDPPTGVEIKAGDATRTLVGMLRPNTAGLFANTLAYRAVRSWFNEPGIVGHRAASSAGSTSSTTNVEVASDVRLECLLWLQEQITITGMIGGSTASAAVAYANIGLSGLAAVSGAYSYASTGNGVVNLTPMASYVSTSEGFYDFRLLIQVSASTFSFGYRQQQYITMRS